MATGPAPSSGSAQQQLHDRAGKPDYHQWLAGAAATGGCTRPIRLRGTIRDVDLVTGDVLRALNTADLPDRVIYSPAETAGRRCVPPAPRGTAATPVS